MAIEERLFFRMRLNINVLIALPEQPDCTQHSLTYFINIQKTTLQGNGSCVLASLSINI